MKIEREARTILDSWQFWVGVAYFGLAGCVVALFLLYSDQSKDDASRAAADSARVIECRQQVETAPAVIELVNSIELIVTNQIAATVDAIMAQPGNVTLNASRRQSVERMRVARTRVQEFRDRYTKSRPTSEYCDKLARQLHVK